MLTDVKRSLLLWASAAGLCSASPALAGPPLPPVPSPDYPAQAPVSAATPPANAQPAAGALSPQQLYEHVRRGIVAVERNGVPLAVGTVLDGDGRILTSLSALSGSGNADVRYADGSMTVAKVGQGDKESDLALLVPLSMHWTEGLAASEMDPIGAPLRAVVPAHGSQHLGPAEAGVKGRIETHSRDGSPLQPMLDVDVKGPLVAGAPLLDASGSVVAVLVHACRGAAAASPPPESMPWATWGAAQQPGKPVPPTCAPAVVGAPVSAIRSFLSRNPSSSGPAAAATPAATPPAAPGAAAAHTASTPWLGIRGEPTQEGAVRGVRVLAVAPASPSQKAGLRPDADTIVAADGHPIDTPESLGEAISRHAPGDTVKLLVYGDDKFREVPVELRPAP